MDEVVDDFHSRHRQIDPDPLMELKRRLQWWASCPDKDGSALKPDAQIVPLETIAAVVSELSLLRSSRDEPAVVTSEAHEDYVEGIVSAVRQSLMDAAHVHRGSGGVSSGIYKSEVYATNAIRAHLKHARPSSPPPGWKLVPVEPTEEMLEAIAKACCEYETNKDDPRYESWWPEFKDLAQVYHRAMLSSAPEAKP